MRVDHNHRVQSFSVSAVVAYDPQTGERLGAIYTPTELSLELGSEAVKVEAGHQRGPQAVRAGRLSGNFTLTCMGRFDWLFAYANGGVLTVNSNPTAEGAGAIMDSVPATAPADNLSQALTITRIADGQRTPRGTLVLSSNAADQLTVQADTAKGSFIWQSDAINTNPLSLTEIGLSVAANKATVANTVATAVITPGLLNSSDVVIGSTGKHKHLKLVLLSDTERGGSGDGQDTLEEGIIYNAFPNSASYAMSADGFRTTEVAMTALPDASTGEYFNLTMGAQAGV